MISHVLVPNFDSVQHPVASGIRSWCENPRDTREREVLQEVRIETQKVRAAKSIKGGDRNLNCDNPHKVGVMTPFGSNVTAQPIQLLRGVIRKSIPEGL
ncbi:hypothetical protein VMCG_07940 [Cytospora schulzeri]|uniref:Uncharacterized protein n=1 Tax=Cytospora schulzeri TaxID=448051 RepID=A0A423VY45_9PEZI|nr:hypothetical protein VMCG_07940 [Valsa malicola]